MASTTALVAIAFAVIVLVGAGRVVAWRLLGSARGLRPVVQATGSSLWRGSGGVRSMLERRIPRLYGALARRFDPAAFGGLTLTLIAVAAVTMVAAFAGLIDDVRESDGIVRLDQIVDDAFAPLRAPWVLKGFLWITALGAGPCLAAMVVLASALLWSGRRMRFAPPLWIAFLGAQATTWSSKYMIDRPRPAFLPDITEWNPSFPSGHATAVTALIGMLGYVVARDLVGRRERFDVGYATVVIIGLICFSRLFLGVHFLSDVLAGLLVGSFWLLVGVTVYELGQVRKIPIIASAGPTLAAPDSLGTPRTPQ